MADWRENLGPLYNALAPAPNTEYGSVLPVAREGNALRFAMPDMVRSGLTGLLDLAASTETGTLTGNALGALTMGSMGTGATLAPRNALAAGGSIRAYHGSPHNFDRFDSNKIGTGEGAQAYGHGLYFAGNEDVARVYRTIGAPAGQNYRSANLANEALRRASAAGLSGDDAKRFAMKWLNEQAPKVNAAPPQAYYDAMNNFDALTGGKGAHGHMYEVAIHADPQRFLDWDKPLSGQGKTVQSFFDQFPMSGKEWNTYTGGDMYRRISGSSQAAAHDLYEAGIPGIRYLDQGSRTAGHGSHNYVVFPNQDEIIEILRKYGLAAPAPVAPPSGNALTAAERRQAIAREY